MKLVLNAEEKNDLFENFLDAHSGALTVSVAFSAYDDNIEHEYQFEYPSKRKETLEIVLEPSS